LREKYSHKIIDGKELSDGIKIQLKNKLIKMNEKYDAKFHETPCFGYILVGEKAESATYVKFKRRACE